MYKDYSAKTFAFKVQASPKVSIGFADYLSGGIYLDYANAGDTSGTGITNANVDLSIKSRMLVAKYQFDDFFSVFGGLKRSTVRPATANVLAGPGGNLLIASASDNAMAFGMAFEKPEIALRVSLLFQEKTDFSLPMTSSSGTALINGTAGLPTSMTIRFQSGIAKDTLIYGSIHDTKWGKSQIYFDNGASTGTLTQKSTYDNSTTYNLGVARKLNEDFGLSASYTYEAGTAPTGTSPLATTNGKTSLSLGGKYTKGRASFSLGFSRVKVGDKELTGTFASKFTDNTTNVVAAKIGLNF
jgi:long-subunit fatty acid transport protein